MDGGQPPPDPPAQAGRPPAARGVVRALVPALLALPEPPDLQGRVELVRARDRHQRTTCWRTTSRSPGCPRTSRRASSASGSRVRATGRSAATQPLLGLADPGVEERRPELPARRRLRLARRHGGRLRPPSGERRRRVDLHRPYIDDLTRPNPDDPTGKSTMRRIEDVLDVWFDSARCRSRRCTTRSRTTSGSTSTPPPTSSSSTSGRRAAGST